MDLLKRSAKAYRKLMLYEYHFVLGRKGKKKEFVLNFDEADFHHLAGLHKLRDIARLQYGKRSTILQDILKNRITLETIQKSNFYSEMSMRLSLLLNLEKILDNNQIIFRYNKKRNIYSLIDANYLLESDKEGEIVYLFLGERKAEGQQMCKSIFPKGERDYTLGQEKYTLLRMEKIYLPDSKVVLAYQRSGSNGGL